MSRWLLILVSLLCVRCVLSPVPTPPGITQEKLDVEIQTLMIDDVTFTTARITGYSGAVTPNPTAIDDLILRGVNLDRTEMAVEVTVEDDGSFLLVLGGDVGDLFRLWAIHGGLTSQPVEIKVSGPSGPAVPSPRPLGECLIVDPEPTLDFGEVLDDTSDSRAVTIANECADTIRIEDIWLRINANEPPACVNDYEQCLIVEADEIRDCETIFSGCEDDCQSAWESCVADDLPCDVELELCLEECHDTRQWCYGQVCGDATVRCGETQYEEPQGFSVTHEPLPITIASGNSEVINVLFEPLGFGPAEDVLIIEVVSPEEGTILIELMGISI